MTPEQQQQEQDRQDMIRMAMHIQTRFSVYADLGVKDDRPEKKVFQTAIELEKWLRLVHIPKPPDPRILPNGRRMTWWEWWLHKWGIWEVTQ